MRTASPPYDRHLAEVNELLDAGRSRSEIRSAIDEAELEADQKAALWLVVSSSNDSRVEAREQAQRKTAIAGAKDRAWRLALQRRSQRRRQRDDGMRYGDTLKYDESGEATSPPPSVIARVRRLLHP